MLANFSSQRIKIPCPVIQLEPFDARKTVALIRSCHPLLMFILAIANGHPYLIQLGLYSLWSQNISLDELLQQATKDVGIFADHFRRLMWTLKQDSKLAKSLAQVLQVAHPVALELLPAFKLESMGLVLLQGNLAIPSCDLYTQYFRDRLSGD